MQRADATQSCFVISDCTFEGFKVFKKNVILKTRLNWDGDWEMEVHWVSVFPTKLKMLMVGVSECGWWMEEGHLSHTSHMIAGAVPVCDEV